MYVLEKTSLGFQDWLANGISSPDVAGELIRQDIRETQPELDLLLDVQIVNVNTCEPMEGVFVDFWNCNSTGVYSGYEPENTLGETWLRGLQASDENGVVQVLTKFPGWYSGRAQHVHVKAHVNGATLPNNTFSGGEVVHTGQLFFDQSVLTSVNALTPYNEDPNQLTLNTGIISPLTAAPQCLSGPLADLPGRTVDRVIQDQQNTTYYDAFVSIRPLGYDLSYGVIGFINIAIDPDTVPAAAGTNNQTGNSSMPSGGSFNGSMPTGNGSLPSGAMPSGSADVSGGLSSSMNTDIDIVSTASASATVGNGSPTSADDTMGDAATSTSGTVGGAATPSASGGVGSGHDTGSSHRGDRSRGRHHHGQGH